MGDSRSQIIESWVLVTIIVFVSFVNALFLFLVYISFNIFHNIPLLIHVVLYIILMVFFNSIVYHVNKKINFIDRLIDHEFKFF